MNIREISDIFKDTADNITAIRSYNFGWASDRVRQGNTEDFQELNEFPRIFFAVPTITASDQTRKQDTYQVTIFFDDLLGYNNEGDEDPTLQIDKWANLQQYANYFVQRLNKIKQSILPNYLFIPEAPSITFDSFTGLQRMITVQLSFNVVVPTNCDPGVITLVQCIANIVTSSNLTASLTTVLKFAASLEGRATVTADINFVQKAASSLNASALLSGDISFVQKAQASLLTSASVTGNLTIPKTFNASLLATGTTTADLTVGSAFDADAAAFFARVTAAGGTLTTTEQNAVNTLVIAMKADGTWTKMKAIYPMVGGGQAYPAAACAQNLKSSSFTGTFTSGWTFASTGATGNGTSAFLDTGLNLLSNYGVAFNNHFSIYYRTDNKIVSKFGAIGVIYYDGMSSHIVYDNNITYNDNMGRNSLPNASYGTSLGFHLSSLTSTTSQKLFRNNVLKISGNADISAIYPSRSFYFGALNNNGTASVFDNRQIAFGSIGDGLTDTEAANFYTAVQAFQTSLNRQVL
jgi:hypothetical protein